MKPMRQRLLLVVGWIAAAVGSGLVASGAVTVAGGQVLDTPLMPLTAAEVAALPVVQVGSPEDVEPQASGGLVAAPGEPTKGSASIVSGHEEPADTGGSAAALSDTQPLDPIGRSDPSVVRIASVEGGKASFVATDEMLVLLWATPSAGYVAQTRSVTPMSITIQFSSSLNVWIIAATLTEGAIEIVARPEPLT